VSLSARWCIVFIPVATKELNIAGLVTILGPTEVPTMNSSGEVWDCKASTDCEICVSLAPPLISPFQVLFQTRLPEKVKNRMSG